MVDLRYHIASLIGVFLALAVGIVVGSSLGSSERQTAAVRHLQTQFAAVMAEDRRIQEENANQREQLAAREEAIGQLAPLAVRDRLAGQRVALVVCGAGEPAEELPALRETLRVAGAALISTTRLPAPFGPLPPAARTRLIAALSSDGVAAGGDRATPPEETALVTIGQALATGASSRRLHELAGALSVDLEGEYRLPARRLVFLCAAPVDRPTVPEARAVAGAFDSGTAAAVVARAAAGAGAMVVVGETEEMPPLAALRGLSSQGISTIDNLDTAAGRIALVLVLAGAHGDFGAKSAASRLLPPLEANR
jgi:Copper transport outer membrane protein, MctB